MTDQDAQALRLPESTRVERSEEHTSELQSPCNLVCRLLLEKKCGAASKRPISRSIGASWFHKSAVGFAAQVGRVWEWMAPYINFFFFNDTATTEIYPLSLHDALPI